MPQRLGRTGRGSRNEVTAPRPAQASPFLEERAAGVFDALQLQEARPHQQRLHVLLVNGEVAIVGKVDESLQGATGKRRDALQSWVFAPRLALSGRTALPGDGRAPPRRP